MIPTKKSLVKSIGYDEERGEMIIVFHHEESKDCYNYECIGDYNEETGEYEFHCEGCKYQTITPAHDEYYCYKMSKEQYEEYIGNEAY